MAARRSAASRWLAGLVFCLWGCSDMKVEDFADRQPILVLETFFAGRTEGWGIMQTRFGTLQKQFRIAAEGAWDPDTRTLHLTETYRFDDGRVDRLEWTIRRGDDGRYEGREPRVDGTASGRQAGNAFHWTYRRRSPAAGDRLLAFDDWFWLQPDGVLIARASVRRFGLEIATMSVFYRRLDP